MRIALALASALLVLSPALASAADAAKPSPKVLEKRAKIDANAETALKELFEKQPGAKALQEKAFGYAAFDATKAAFIVSGGGGSGVAVEKASGKRVYMSMGTGGVGIGLGVQSLRVVFFFQTEEAFKSFVYSGWQAQAGATAAAGNEGANAEATFSNGIAYYVMTDKGFMLNADIAGTKYSKNDKLN